MLVKLILERERGVSRTFYVEIESTDDVLFKGAAFKKFNFEAHMDGDQFVVRAKAAHGEYPRMFLTNDVTMSLNTIQIDHLVPGQHLLDYAAQKLLGDKRD